jgi:hypothetical protein
MTINVLDKDGKTVALNTIADLMLLVGEVQPTPTANTVLDRLKSLLAQLVTNHGDGHTDLLAVISAIQAATVQLATNHDDGHTDVLAVVSAIQAATAQLVTNHGDGHTDAAAIALAVQSLLQDRSSPPATLVNVGDTIAINTQAAETAAFTVTGNSNITALFEALAPDGTTWVSVAGYPFAGGAGITTVPANAVGSWYVPCGGFLQVRMRVTAVGTAPSSTVAAGASRGGNMQALLNLLQGALPAGTASIGNLNAPPVNTYIGTVNTEGLKATYRYEAIAVAPVATPTDFIVLQGSATKTVKVKRIVIGGEATAAAQMVANLIRRSTADTGGTATTNTPANSDKSDPAATAVLKTYTANPTALGTVVATIVSRRVGLNPNTGLPATPVELSFGVRNDEPIVLRGAADFLAINLGGAAVPAGGKLDFAIEWTEE